MTDTRARRALQARLELLDQEIDDLRCLLSILQAIERDAELRERLGLLQLGFRLQDLATGRVTGEPLRGALASLEYVIAAPARTAA